MLTAKEYHKNKSSLFNDSKLQAQLWAVESRACQQFFLSKLTAPIRNSFNVKALPESTRVTVIKINASTIFLPLKLGMKGLKLPGGEGFVHKL